VLLKWWAEQNLKERHLWAGDAPNRIGPNRSATEIVSQIRLTRQQPATGNIHWSMSALLRNRGGIADALIKEVYAQPALVPASPWLKHGSPGAPKLTVDDVGNLTLKLSWQQTGAEPAAWWVLQTRTAGEWTLNILPGQQLAHVLKSNVRPEVIALTAVDRCGNASSPTALQFIGQSR